MKDIRIKKFSLRPRDLQEDERTGALVRIVDLIVGDHVINCFLKVSRYEIERYSHLKVPINEVCIQMTYEKVAEFDNDNRKRDEFIKKHLTRKLRENKINIPFINIKIDKKPNIKEIEQMCQFLIDVIYSHPKISLIVPPKVTLPEEAEVYEKYDSFRTFLTTLSDILESYQTDVRVGYFIPDYIPRTKFFELIEYYLNKFGENALIILDAGGKRFSAGSYSDVSLVHRKMSFQNIESYAIYLFNHKGRKKSGREAPSEDLLALLNGVNLVGPNHKVIRLPRNVAGREGTGKIFSEEDFLFYPENIAPNVKEFQNFYNFHIKGKSKEKKDQARDIFNDIKINASAILLSSNATETLSNLKRDEFKDVLKTIAKNRQNILQQKSLESFT